MSSASIVYRPGLRGVVAAETRVSHIDGEKGRLTLRGFDVEEVAPRASFEEMVWLLWNEELPRRDELARFADELRDRRALPAVVTHSLRQAPTAQTPPIDALRLAVGALDIDVAPADREADELAKRLVARLPTVVAAYDRLRRGHEPITPNPDLGHAANYLFMLSGDVPSAARTRALETYLNTVSDHGFNASTFTARVITATDSDFVSAICGAVGALKGPRHGGAPGPALDMVFEIGNAENAEPYLRAKLERGERLMGFGHRVYKVRDPRADVLAAAAERLYARDGDVGLYELAKDCEGTAVRLLAEYKPGRGLDTNVEFYTALLLHGLGFDPGLFTPTFAVARVAGWTAHCYEQVAADELIRPLSRYVGASGCKWLPVDER